MKNEQRKKWASYIIGALSLLTFGIYIYDEEKYSIFYLISSIFIAILMWINLFDDPTQVNPFRKSNEGYYTERDRAKVFIFFAIISFLAGFILWGGLKIVFLLLGIVCSLFAYKLWKNDN